MAGDVSLTMNEQEMRALLRALSLPPSIIKKSAAAFLRKRFKEYVLYARTSHFSGGPARPGTIGRVGMSTKPGRYGHLADAFSVKLKQAKDKDNFGMYAKTMMNKGDHGFIAPMHEFGTGDRYRNRKSSIARHGREWTERGFGFTGSLPARRPFAISIASFLLRHNLNEELEAVIVKSVEKAVNKAGKS